MEKWLSCSISPGLFDGEFAVKGELADGSGFSLFAEEDDLKYEGVPTSKQSVAARIHVETGLEEDNLLLVTLPRPTFENGQTITVRIDQLD